MNTDHETVSKMIYLAGIGTASSIGYKEEAEKNKASSTTTLVSLEKWFSTFSRHLHTGKA